MKSFVARGERYILYAYRKHNVPRGVEIVDAATIIPKSGLFFYKNPDGTNRSVSAFTNLFRYSLLERFGGWWVDTDVLRLDAPVFDDELVLGWQDARLVCSAILRAPPGHRLMTEARQQALASGTDNLVWGQTGPKLVTALVTDLGLADRVKPRDVAYPTHWREYPMPVQAAAAGEMQRRTKGAPFLHLWHEMFRLDGDSRLDAPEAGSFLDRQYRKLKVRRRPRSA